MGICPLREISASIDLSNGVEYSDASCLKGECAWWDNLSRNCVILTLTTAILGNMVAGGNQKQRTGNESPVLADKLVPLREGKS